MQQRLWSNGLKMKAAFPKLVIKFFGINEDTSTVFLVIRRCLLSHCACVQLLQPRIHSQCVGLVTRQLSLQVVLDWGASYHLPGWVVHQVHLQTHW